MERSLLVCALHYLVHVWWTKMINYNPGKNASEQKHYRNGKFVTAIYILIASTVSYLYAGGFWGLFSVVIIPFIVFTYHIAFFTYLHHTHPNMPLYEKKSEWSHSIAAIGCTSVINFSNISRIMYHNIMVHLPHHLDTRIPFYHLPEAYSSIKSEYGRYVNEYDFKWRKVFVIFRKCKLYDYEDKRWLTYKEARSI